MEKGTVVITKNTFDRLRERFFTRPNKAENSEKYTTYFPALKYYRHLAGEIDAIRINKECLLGQRPETFFCVQGSYLNADRTKHYRVICIHPNKQPSRSARGLSDIISARILRAIGWEEDFKKNNWVEGATPTK